MSFLYQAVPTARLLYALGPEKAIHFVRFSIHPATGRLKEKIITFEQVARAWENQHTEEISFKTAEAYTAPTNRIVSQFGDRSIKEITAADIVAYLSHLAKQDYSRRTVQMHRDILNMIFNYAIVAGHITANPCAAASMPRNLPTTKRELPSDDTIQAVRDGADAPFGLSALICLYAGLRRGEALALTYEDIDREANLIHVTKSVEFVGNNPHIKSPSNLLRLRPDIEMPSFWPRWQMLSQMELDISSAGKMEVY